MQTMSRRAALGIGVSALTAAGASLWPRPSRAASRSAPPKPLVVPVNNHVVAAAAPQAPHVHDAVSAEYIRQMQGVLLDLKNDTHVAESMHRGAAITRVFAAHMEARGADQTIQKLAKMFVEDRGRSATLLLEPDYTELEKHVRATAGTVFPLDVRRHHPNAAVWRERSLDAFLRGEPLFTREIRNFAARLDEIGTKIEKRRVARVVLAQGQCQYPNCGPGECDLLLGVCYCPCTDACGAADLMKSIMEGTCAFVAGCSVTPPCWPILEAAADACGSVSIVWGFAAATCAACVSYYNCM
jgi:hypothetical protein